MQAFAEANERRATGLLVSSYVERGRQSFIDGANAESLALFNEARKINPRVSGINWMMADIWKQLSPLQEEISGEREAIAQLFFSNDGTTLVSQDTHGRIRRFELGLDPARLTMASHQFISFMQHPMIFSSTPHLIGYFEQTNPESPNFLSREIRRVNWHTGREVDSIAWGKDQRKPDLIVASPGGSRLATYTDAYGDQPRRIVRLWKFASDATIESQIELPESPGNFHWFFSADEQTLIQLRYSGSTFDITFRNSSTGKILQHFPLNSRPEAHATFKNRICIGLSNGEIIEFQCDQEISQRSPSDKIVSQLGTLQYSSDGKQLLAGGTLGEVGLYRCEDFSVTMKLDREQIDGVVKHVALSDQGHFISVAHKNSVSIFEAPTSKRFGHFSWAGSEASSCTFSNDEKQLAVGTESGNIRIWSVEKQPAWHQEYQPVGEQTLTDISLRKLLRLPNS